LRAALLLAGLCFGCSSNVAFLSSDGLSTLVLIEVGFEPKATAYDLTNAPVVEQEASGDTYALGYVSSVATLRMAPGPLSLSANGSLLPPAEGRHHLEGSEWIAVTELPTSIENLRYDLLPRCSEFDASQQRVLFQRQGEETVTAAVALDPERVLAATSVGRFFIITSSATIPLTQLSTATPHWAAVVHDGEVWLVGPGRRVMHGRPERGFVDAPPLPFDLRNASTVVVSAQGDAPFELFVTTAELAVAHFDGRAWRQIRGPSPLGEEGRQQQGLVWIEPGTVALLGTSASSVLDLAVDGSERQSPVDLPTQPSIDTIWAAAWIDGVGPVIGSRYAIMFRRDGDGWSRLSISTTLTPRVDFILDLGEGAFLAGGQSGQYVERGPGPEFCPTPHTIGGGSPMRFARLGDGWIAFTADDTQVIARLVTRL